MTRLCLSGDVMLGRGIDQILRYPVDPRLYEDYAKSARDYVVLAEQRNGPIPRGVEGRYVWGDALAAIAERQPDCCVMNLETAVTDRGEPLPKGINYRMSPSNAVCLHDPGPACYSLANNHVFDWGSEGLSDTFTTLRALRLPFAGAGDNAGDAASPAALPLPGGGRVLVFGMACPDSGVPASWAATAESAGLHVLSPLDGASLDRIGRLIADAKRPGDIAVVSIHWGDNWGYQAPPRHRAFARSLVSEAGADVVHGHSSHHPKQWEIHEGKLILYGCGDLINDYEGIAGREDYRGDISALYFADVEAASGRLAGLIIAPFRIRRFRLGRAGRDDAAWLMGVLNRECLSGHALRLLPDSTLALATSLREEMPR
jgi:poly-gamma-glutamate capsule biosynthesis protein CapA/YwtB (metallophosphatase superfamily)